MATPTEILEVVLTTLKNNLPEIERASSTSYLPALQSGRVALIGISQGHEDEIIASSLAGHVFVHRLRLRLWTKVVQGRETEYQQIARDVGYRAMRVLVANDETGGYSLYQDGNGAVQMRHVVEDVLIGVAEQPYLMGTIVVPVWQYEEQE